MRNQAPIFLNCFSRGGSNILWNLFLTHPDVCSPLREMLQIFRVGLRHGRPEGYKAAWLSRQWRLFDQWHLAPRRPLPEAARQYIDAVLYRRKLDAFADEDMRFRREGEPYTLDQVKAARLVVKNNNGLAFLSDVLLDMYPDATFVGLVRHPVALYESHKRRRLTRSPEQFAAFYRAIAGRMLHDAERYERYHLIRFEEMMADPVGMMRSLHARCGLDPDAVQKLRLKAKPHLHADGDYTTRYEPGRHYWFDFSDVYQMLEPKINAYHAQQLSPDERARLLSHLEETIAALGYPATLPA